MIKISFTLEEKDALELQNKKSCDCRERDRIKVVLRSENWCYSWIAQALRIDETTVKRHLDDYCSSKNLRPENCGSTS